MPKLSRQLTITQFKNLKPKEKPYFVSDGDNLLVKIMPNGTKFFIYEFRENDKRHRLTLGKYDEMSLSEARDKRSELRSKLNQGESLTQTAEKTKFKAVFEAWYKTKSKLSEKQQFWIKRRFETLFLPKFGEIGIKEITRRDIIAALAPLLGDDKQETIRKTLGTLNSFYKFALLHEYVEHNIISDIDKSALIGKKDVKHFAYLKNDDEIRAVLMAIRDYFGDIRVKTCAIFQLYTAVRGQNARNAKWSQIDFENCLWHIPASEMKTARAHEVFLSKSVINLLKIYRERLPLKSELIFPSIKSNVRPISDNTIRSMLRNLGFNNDMVTPHGFRATFSTVANENIDKHGCNSDVIELCLAHTESNKVKDAYNHAKNLKARAKLMQWWSDYLDSLGGFA
ncbi:tyrosine-type recombinase/integrase [Campylobacter concisus]|uniref:tyrosine-type recombinase/integrase n=1 Tax=Campylobacter concisus TaxID=199 RepID=UPI000CD81663|nr:tyrosine-type recombinase/integrase [Campylobacter concisus]